MKRRLFINLWTAVLTFCLGLSLSALWRIYSLPEMPAPVALISMPALPVGQTAEQTAFATELHACGPNGNYHLYVLEDGSRVSVFCRSYPSEWAANRELTRLVRRSRIVEVSKNDSEVGRIIVAVPEGVQELSRYRRSLCVTSAPSLKQLRSR